MEVYVIPAQPQNFRRKFSSEKIHKLKQNPLFCNCLHPDVRARKIFPAIRVNKMHFYHDGGRLFEFDGRGFSTHIKYVTGLSTANLDSVRESQLSNLRPVDNFIDGYESIKELCRHYAGREDAGIARLYHGAPFTRYSKEHFPCVVLDIEASFDSRQRKDDKKSQDRPDLVLYNTNERELMFVEAKHFGDSRIKTKDQTPPPVIGQIAEYEAQLRSQTKAILDAYSEYIDLMNRVFGLKLLGPPKRVVPVVPLWIFGHDKDHLTGKFGKVHLAKLKDGGLYCPNKQAFGQMKNSNTLMKWFREARKHHPLTV